MSNKATDGTGIKILYICTPAENAIIEKIRAANGLTKTKAIDEALHTWETLQAAQKELRQTQEKLSVVMQKMKVVQDNYRSINQILAKPLI